jgi:Tfp pilus assembly protein PilN
MLHTNLSTRPFYNVRAVRTALGALAVVVLAISIFNGVRIVRLTLAQRTLGAHATESEREAARLRQEAAAIVAQINPRELGIVATAAREANGIIDQRAFSWTELFSQFERTLPPDVRVMAVQPRLDSEGAFVVSIRAQARRIGDLDAFIEALEGESTFRNVLSLETETDQDGLLESTIQGTYLPRPRPAPEVQP